MAVQIEKFTTDDIRGRAPVPLRELLVSLLPRDIKHQNAYVSLVIVARMHGVETLLASRIPKVHLGTRAVVKLHILPEESQSVGGVLQGVGGVRGEGVLAERGWR
jgi:hypothetical protein